MMSLFDPTKARASFYAFLSIHFMHLPDALFARALCDEAYSSALRDLERDKEVHPEIVQGASLMQAYLEKSQDLDEEELAKRLGVDRTRLYRGVSPQYGPIPPFEVLWREEHENTSVLQELANIYAQNGFTLKPDVCERLDYIGIQMNYLECLVMNEISARESGDEEIILRSLGQESEFLWNHWGKWVPKFAMSALDHAQTDFYRGHLHMLIGFIEQEKDTLKSCP